MGVLTKKGEQMRTRILDATAELVVRRGAAHTSLDDIRDATGTSKSQLFHYFPDGKAQLLAEVERTEAVRILDEQRPVLDALDSWEAWDAWVEVVRRLYRRKIEGCPMAALNGRSADYDPEAPDPILQMYRAWLGAMTNGLASMQRAGLVAVDVDPEDLATATLATIQGGVLIMQATASVRPLDVAIAAATGHLRSFAVS
jgi:AcrR family transcriptional regulator